MSIDIDSDDLAVWASISCYNPKIVIIEINSAIPPGILLWHGPSVQGNSFSSTLAVGRDKGYSLVCHTGNMIFVRDDLLPKIGLDPIFLRYPELLFDPAWYLDITRKPQGHLEKFKGIISRYDKEYFGGHLRKIYRTIKR